MIGQHKLLATIDNMLESGFPRFTIIVGGMRSGKKLLANYISQKLNAHTIYSDIKVDDIREIINLSYKQSEPTVYVIPNADKMSIAAKNALLKVTEEPPRQSYFIMTLLDDSSTLATLKSRGTMLYIQPYTPDELMEYAVSKGYNIDHDTADALLISQICSTPGEVDLLVAQGNIVEFYDFVNTVVDNIGKVNGANAFKIALKLDLKDNGEEGYNINLFLKTIIYVLGKRMLEEPKRAYVDCIRITSNYISQLSIKGVNKASTIDMWILEMRGALIEDE